MVHLLLNRQCEELSYPQNLKMCDPITVTPLKTQPHYSHSSHENVTPSSGTSLLASNKEVPPSLPPWAIAIHLLNILLLMSITQSVAHATVKGKTDSNGYLL